MIAFLLSSKRIVVSEYTVLLLVYFILWTFEVLFGTAKTTKLSFEVFFINFKIDQKLRTYHHKVASIDHECLSAYNSVSIFHYSWRLPILYWRLNFNSIDFCLLALSVAEDSTHLRNIVVYMENRKKCLTIVLAQVLDYSNEIYVTSVHAAIQNN